MSKFSSHTDKSVYALMICLHRICVCEESRSPGQDFVVVSAFKGILPEDLIVRNGFIKPGLCSKIEMDDLRVVKACYRTSGHAVPARVQIMDMVLTKGIDISP